ncbi:MAG: hypothetical protein L3J22_09920 [Xanthomonadales bacterium]|nr:hypothetical protein [Xanthomonadales bacterium]
MQGIITFSIVEENHTGPIGDDWKYWVEAKVYNEGLKGEAIISVPEHTFPADTIQNPPGPLQSIKIPAGDCGKPVKIKILAEATEVDIFKNDVGKKNIDLSLQCPSANDEPLIVEREIQIGVVETPNLSSKTSLFTIKVRFVLNCE